jgi:hypothetical protein
MKKQTKRKNFSRFTLKEAFKHLKIKNLTKFNIDFKPIEPSQFFQIRLQRLENFDLSISEKAKELLIDAICEEVIQQHPHLKIWKEAPLQSDKLTGFVDYTAHGHNLNFLCRVGKVFFLPTSLIRKVLFM